MTALSQAPDAPPDTESTPTLAALVRQHQSGVWRLLRCLGADAAEADDLTQETFLALARSGFRHESPPQTAAYLRTTARNQLLMLRRRQKRQISTVAIDAAQAVWAERVEQSGWQAFADALRACTEKLEGRARQAIDLAYQDGLGRDQIADQLGMKADGVKTLLRRTRTVLRECIERSV